MFSTNSVVDKDSILTKIPQEEIFKKYLGIDVVFGKGLKNPLRKDNHGDCYFYTDSNNMLKFKDIPMGRGWNWDCFNVVQKVHSCNFNEALNIIAVDFNLKELSPDIELIKKRRVNSLSNSLNKKIIKVETRNWFTKDIEFWKQFNISIEILNFYNVFPLRQAYLIEEESSREIRVYKYKTLDDLGYCYFLKKGEMKLYFPFRNRENSEYPRFYHNCPLLLQGFSQLPPMGEDLIITKSAKDVMSMFSFGIDSVANISETIMIGENYMKNLKLRFKNIYTLYDRDRTGVRMSLSMKKKYGTTPLLVPSNKLFAEKNKKDFSDMVKIKTKKEMFEFINSFKNGKI